MCADADNVIFLDAWASRRASRSQTRFQRALAVLEPAQREAVLALSDAFGTLAESFWPDLAPAWTAARREDPLLPPLGTPLAELEEDALIAISLEAGYTLGTTDHFKAVLPYFLAGAFAHPLETWVIDPDLLKAKLETLGFESWPGDERRLVACALRLYAQHEIDLADRDGDEDDEALVATRVWAEDVFAAAR